MKCPRCNGSGQIYDPIDSHYGFKICSFCEANGKVDGRHSYVKAYIKLKNTKAEKAKEAQG